MDMSRTCRTRPSCLVDGKGLHQAGDLLGIVSGWRSIWPFHVVFKADPRASTLAESAQKAAAFMVSEGAGGPLEPVRKRSGGGEKPVEIGQKRKSRWLVAAEDEKHLARSGQCKRLDELRKSRRFLWSVEDVLQCDAGLGGFRIEAPCL